MSETYPPQTPDENETNQPKSPKWDSLELDGRLTVNPSKTSAPADDSQYWISDKELGLDNVAPSDAKVVGVGETDEPYFDY